MSLLALTSFATHLRHWLYHGTSLEGETGITEGDFRLNLAGSNAGTLYGTRLSFKTLGPMVIVHVENIQRDSHMWPR